MIGRAPVKRVGRLVAVIAAALVVVSGPSATAGGDPEFPAEGSITIADAGLGPHATWSYTDGVDLNCNLSWSGPTGVPQDIKVTCTPSQTAGRVFTCPEMIVQRATESFVGARASCTRTLEMGVGSSAFAAADLGPVGDALVCEAYVDVGVLPPPYSVTCSEPALPTVGPSLTSTATG